MKTNIAIDISPPYLAKFWVLNDVPKCCQPIKFQDSLNRNLKKEVNDKFIFCMPTNIEVFYKLILSFW